MESKTFDFPDEQTRIGRVRELLAAAAIGLVSLVLDPLLRAHLQNERELFDRHFPEVGRRRK